MKLSDIFRTTHYKEENDRLQSEIASFKDKNNKLQSEINILKVQLTPEITDVINCKKIIEELKQNILDLKSQENSKQQEIQTLDSTISAKKSQVIEMDEKILLQEFGLYEPKYDFTSSVEYKERLDLIRNKQKTLLKNGDAATASTTWTVNNNAAQGRKMIKDMQKLLLRAFNSECDELINKVKYNTLDTAKKRINASCEAISKLGKVMNISISSTYFNLKLEELYLAFEYRQKQQEEKEEQRAIKAQMREDAKLLKEIEAERKKIQKEQAHYENALKTLIVQIASASSDELPDLLSKKEDIDNKLIDIQKSIEKIDYREANHRAGYVYIISNIGSFGEDIYKIGMTRRLDPTERVYELGDASVPFNFDIHAMIFSEDAPALENALHKAFENKKLNMVNHRREFFKVSLDEIKTVVKENFDKTVEFIDIADAEQYRLSEKIRNQ